jgi:ribosomal protein S12 methylthiotransferase accessory factor
LNRIPKFRNDLRIKVVPPDLCFFFHETGYEVLESHLICLIAPLINGKNSVSSIAKSLKGDLTSFDLECILLILEDEGWLENSSDEYIEDLDVFSELLGITAKAFEKEIKKSKINVVTFGEVSPEPFRSLMKNIGIKISEKADFTVVLTDDYLRNEFIAFNERAVLQKMKWMIAKPTGTVFWSGPVFSQGRPPCWECMARRLSENLRAQTFQNLLEGFTSRSKLQMPALNLIAIETIKNLTSQNLQPPAIQTLNVKTMELRNHFVISSDECKFCSKGNNEVPTRISLEKKPLSVNHRSANAGDTFRKYQHLISPITGIVHEITITETDNAIYSSTAKHPFVVSMEKEYPQVLRLKRTSLGKGVTPQSSTTGALCEALERYSGIFRGNEKRVKASCKALKETAIHPYDLLNFSDSQYKNRQNLNQSNSDHDWIPVPLNQNRIIDWTPVWSLTYNTIKYVPTAYCYYGYFLPPNQRFCRADSNGNASGNTIEEAILYGILELVERDAVAMWWFNRIQRSLLNLESFPLSFLPALQENYRILGRDIRVFEITNDFRIPTFAAVSAINDSQFLFGFAADIDPLTAVSRALLEMNQFVETSGRNFDDAANNLKFLIPEPSISKKNFQDFRERTRIDPAKEILKFVQLAKERSMETLILNQTRFDIGLPVVKAIIPGMRQFWARFAKGRLYDVPVKMRWRETPMHESELNPYRL